VSLRRRFFNYWCQIRTDHRPRKTKYAAVSPAPKCTDGALNDQLTSLLTIRRTMHATERRSHQQHSMNISRELNIYSHYTCGKYIVRKSNNRITSNGTIPQHCLSVDHSTSLLIIISPNKVKSYVEDSIHLFPFRRRSGRQETHQHMRQENVTRNFQLPPKPHHGCQTLPALYSVSPWRSLTSSGHRDFWLLHLINILTYLLMSFLLINIVALKSTKSRLGISQGHWKWHHSIDRIWVPIRLPL